MENSGILLSAKADLNRVLVSDGPPQTALCLLSPPLPSIVNAVKFTIISHDQGYCDDPNAGTWTWFETSILRPQADSRDISSDLFDDVNDNVEDFIDQIAGHGWSFVEIPGTGGRTSIVLARNPVSRSWQTHEMVWDRNDNEEKRQFVSLLQEGDRVVVWARAQV
ncbi:hypothetical protein VTN00DRAFT_5410 [Thermoascus crustaceus]|uniref:uncharacterized protein n=1 Tax=Thermoascus crustaceus TaxID=5088 RepID=UPI0037449F63